jgi:hypothetical protein
MLYRPKSSLKERLAHPRHWLARGLSRAASKIAPELSRREPCQLPVEELLEVAGGTRADPLALQDGKVNVRYRAVDPIWRDESEVPEGMIPLRQHMIRLCAVAEELANRGHSEDWRAVSENLHLAASLRDLDTDTDVSGDSFMCGAAADFDAAHSEVAAKYLAGVIVFNLAWTAYEGAVEIASRPAASKHAKGAKGRDLVFRVVGDERFPFLRGALFDALDVASSECVDFRSREMRRMLAAGSMAGIAAEYLRAFRNALAHGTLRKPLPDDWGRNSPYLADNDPAIRQFHANTRLALLLSQIIMRFASNESYQFRAWVDEPQPVSLVLTQLHCQLQLEEADELPLIGAPLVKWKDSYTMRQAWLRGTDLNR